MLGPWKGRCIVVSLAQCHTSGHKIKLKLMQLRRNPSQWTYLIHYCMLQQFLHLGLAIPRSSTLIRLENDPFWWRHCLRYLIKYFCFVLWIWKWWHCSSAVIGLHVLIICHKEHCTWKQLPWAGELLATALMRRSLRGPNFACESSGVGGGNTQVEKA